jgi:hypothetical protein
MATLPESVERRGAAAGVGVDPAQAMRAMSASALAKAVALFSKGIG